MDWSLNDTLHLRMWDVFSLCIFLLFSFFFFFSSACLAVDSHSWMCVLAACWVGLISGVTVSPGFGFGYGWEALLGSYCIAWRFRYVQEVQHPWFFRPLLLGVEKID